jgi:hypothetical protein
MNPNIRSFYLDYLRAVASKKADTFAVSGEEDSVQTKFERMSNDMEIGVFGPDEDVNCLLFILRVLVDKNYDLLEIFCSDKELEITPDNLMKTLRESELVYITKGATPHLQATKWFRKPYCNATEVMVDSENTKFYQLSELYSMMEAV